MVEKHKLHNVRLDDEVWAAIKGMDCSLNQYLRTSLLDVSTNPPVLAVDRTQVVDSAVVNSVDQPVIDNRPKNCFCKHCGSRFAGPKFSTICGDCKGSGHTLSPAECPACANNSATGAL